MTDPSLKVTVPAGLPPPGKRALTVALRVREDPYGAGLRLLVKLSSVDALVICWTSDELLPS